MNYSEKIFVLMTARYENTRQIKLGMIKKKTLEILLSFTFYFFNMHVYMKKKL